MAKRTKESMSDEKSETKTLVASYFSPWEISSWKSTALFSKFVLELVDAVAKSKKGKKQLDCYLFEVPQENTPISVSDELLNSFGSNPRPLIIIAKHKTKLKYLLFTEHYLNLLISENPSRAAHAKINIGVADFTTFTKAKIKDIREFVYHWQRFSLPVLAAGTYFKFKDGLKKLVSETIQEVGKLGIDVNLDVFREIDSSINRAIYTVAIVGPTKAGKSTIINSLVSRNVSPINIRPTTGIPTNIVPGEEERAEILFQDDRILTGAADSSFLNDYVSIDLNRGNKKGVKMVTVWVKSSQMEKGLSFCDFPGLDDADVIIEKTVAAALQFANAIIYVIDASGNEKGFKFPKQYRDDLLSLQNKDRIFLVVNKIDSFSGNEQLLEEYKTFLNEELEYLDLKKFLPQPPIFMQAKKSYDERLSGINSRDEMTLLEEEVWNHLLSSSKSGLHNLLNIISQVNQEANRSIRTIQTRLVDGERQKELSDRLAQTERELLEIKYFEQDQREEIRRWLFEILESEKRYLIANYRSHLSRYGLNQTLPNYRAIQTFLTTQFSQAAPEIFEQLENEITRLNNELNNWVNNRLQSVEVTIDTYSRQEFTNSDAYKKLLHPIANIFSESYGKHVPTNMLGNILYHIFNSIETLGDWLWRIFTDAQTVRSRRINSIMSKLNVCYDDIFNKMYTHFSNHLDLKCKEILGKVVDRTNIYTSGLNRQIRGLDKPLVSNQRIIYELASEKIAALDSACQGLRLEIEEYSLYLKPKVAADIKVSNDQIEKIELELRRTIKNVLTKKVSPDARKVVPSHVQLKIDERIAKVLRDHPKSKKEKFETLEAHLQYMDLPEYFDIISTKLHWEHFESLFNNKENLKKHFVQLSSLRNCIRHSREITPLVRAEGEASILFFSMALGLRFE